MKMTIGGSMGFKIQGKPYETIEANSYLSIEIENSDGLTDEAILKLKEKIDRSLKEDATNKLKNAFDIYKNRVEHLRKVGD